MKLTDILTGILAGSFVAGTVLSTSYGTTFTIRESSVRIAYSDGVRETRRLLIPPRIANQLHPKTGE